MNKGQDVVNDNAQNDINKSATVAENNIKSLKNNDLDISNVQDVAKNTVCSSKLEPDQKGKNDINIKCHGGTFEGNANKNKRLDVSSVQDIAENTVCSSKLEDITAALEATIQTLRGQLSVWDQAKLIADLCAKVGRGCVPKVAQETSIPKRTLFYLAEIGGMLADYDALILDTPLAHQTRCLRTLAGLVKKDQAELVKQAIEAIIDPALPQNTAESAIARLEAQKAIEGSEEEPEFVFRTLTDEEAVNEAFKLIRNDPQATPVQRMIGQYLSLSDQEQVEFLTWLDEHLSSQEDA